MEWLYFVCPHTGQDVEVGIESELETLCAYEAIMSWPAARHAANPTLGRCVRQSFVRPLEPR